MNYSKKGFAPLLGVMLVSALGCDPYAKANQADPTVVRVLAIRPTSGAAYPPAPYGDSTNTTVTGTTWNLTGVCGARRSELVPTNVCKAFVGPSGGPAGFLTTTGRQVIVITFNQQLDGSTVQASPGDCTPASNLAITAVDAISGLPVPQNGPRFRACYQPGGIEGEGGTALIFVERSSTTSAYKDRPDQGRALTPNTRYTVVGTGLIDQNGKSFGFTVNVTTVPSEGAWLDPTISPPAPAGSSGAVCFYTYPSVTYQLACWGPTAPIYTAVTATSVTMSWVAVPGATTYDVQRAPDIGGIPGTFARVATGLATTTFTDTGLTGATTYWYEVIGWNGNLASETGDTSPVTTGLGAPAAPTFTGIGFGFLTVNWVAPTPGPPTGYFVDQAADAFGVPVGYGSVNPAAVTGTTYVVTGLDPATPYWFRVDAQNSAGQLSDGAPATVTTAAGPAAPTFTGVAATTLTVNWTAVTGAATYNVQRAPNVVSGTPPVNGPGTWATVATGLAGTTFNNTSLTTATIYWYRIVAVSTTPVATATGPSASVTTL